MRSKMKCPNCGKRRKPAHERNLKKTGCPKYKPASMLSTTWPDKKFNGGNVDMSDKARKPNLYMKGYKGPSRSDGFSKLGRAIRKFKKKLMQAGQHASGHKLYKVVRLPNPVR